LHFFAGILVYLNEDVPDMESRPKQIRTQTGQSFCRIQRTNPVTRFQAKSSCRGNCTKIVCWSKGDPIPSDYGTHHDSAAKFLAEEMTKQRVQLTQSEERMEVRARSAAGPQLRNQPFLLVKGQDRPGSELNPTIHVGQPCSAVIEERNRLAREIHDTLVQEFAGILLHLEAANGLDKAESQNISEYLARAKELARCGLEDARRMLLGLRPKPLEGAPLSEALRQLAERFSRGCGINCTFSASGRSLKLPERDRERVVSRGAGGPL
jgi:signal transduction histidine kinase